MAIYKKLLDIQTRIEGLTKDANGNAGQYVSGNKVLGFIRPMMNEFGLLLTMDVDEANYQPFETQTKNGTKKDMFCDLKLTFTWIDTTDNEQLKVKWAGTGANGADKSIGSALTYAERYFLLKQFHIPTDKDDVDAIKSPEQEMSDQQAIDFINGIQSVADLDAAWAQYGEPYWKGNKAIIKAFNLRKKNLTNGTVSQR
jgi:hypothetical protein